MLWDVSGVNENHFEKRNSKSWTRKWLILGRAHNISRRTFPGHICSIVPRPFKLHVDSPTLFLVFKWGKFLGFREWDVCRATLQIYIGTCFTCIHKQLSEFLWSTRRPFPRSVMVTRAADPDSVYACHRTFDLMAIWWRSIFVAARGVYLMCLLQSLFRCRCLTLHKAPEQNHL